MIVTAGSATHVGRVRLENEDALYSGLRVWAVADGMGGHAAGEVASGIAVEAMAALDASGEPLDAAAVAAGVAAANEAVLEHARRHRRTRGMGTTLVGAALVHTDEGVRLAVFNVGDSRAYLLTEDRLTAISTDHSEVAEMLALGIIDAEEARTHPLRNIVTRCLGMPDAVEPDLWVLAPAPGDRLLLCSDGLTGEVPDVGVAAALEANADPQAAADALVALALDAGAHDNVTVLVLDVGADR